MGINLDVIHITYIHNRFSGLCDINCNTQKFEFIKYQILNSEQQQTLNGPANKKGQISLMTRSRETLIQF